MRRYKYKRFYKKRKKSDLFFLILKSRFFWLTLLILTISGVVFYFIVFSSFLKIKEIKVFGNKEVAAGDIRKAVFNSIGRRVVFFETKNIFLLDFRKAKKVVLSSFPRISQVEFKRRLFNTLLVEVKERKTASVFCQGDGNCFLIDKKGVIFKKVEKKDYSGLRIRRLNQSGKLSLGEKAVEEEKMAQILDIIKIEDNFKIPLKEILIASDTRLNVKTIEGWEIYFNLEKDLDWQITELKVVLKDIPSKKRKNLKYIDLRFNRVYVFPGSLLNS